MNNNYYKKKQFLPFDSAFGEFLYIGFEIAIIGIARLLISVGVNMPSYIGTILSLLVEIAFAATVFIVSAGRKRDIFSATTLNKKITPLQGVLVGVIAIITLYGFSSITNCFANFLEAIGYKSSSSLEIGSWAKYVFYIFSICVVPAFCEELLFRGLVYNGLRKWNKTAAVFVSALLFMLMHGSPDQTVHQFLLGIVLAMLFSVTGSIWAPMLLHFLNNFIALTVSFVYELASSNSAGETSTSTAEQVAQTSVISFLLSFVIAAAIAVGVFFVIRFLMMSIKKQKEDKEKIVEAEQANAILEGQPLENATESVEPVEETEDITKKKSVTITFFVLSGIYLVYEWFSALAIGLLK